MKINESKKSMIIMVSGIFVLNLGTMMLTPSWWILGLIVGLAGCSLFLVGAYGSIKSIIVDLKTLYRDKKSTSGKIGVIVLAILIIAFALTLSKYL